MKRFIGIALSVLLVLFWGGLVLAQTNEHPAEHPKKTEQPKAEHPKAEHPAKKMTTADIDTAITAHITEGSKADGKFHAKDNVLNKTWDLTLVKVHKDKLTALDAENYFACVDLKADDGTMVDVDFFLKGDHGKLVVTDTSVHKINGEPRYMYEEKDGFWARVDTAAHEHPKAEAKKEHPKAEAKEHPKAEAPASEKKEHPAGEKKEHPAGEEKEEPNN